jgi:conjugal transfer pilus assembly protein TraV
MSSARRALALLTLSMLAGCTNMSGLGGTSDFQCKAPEGIPCQSVSGVHYNERAGNLPSQRAVAGHSGEAGEQGRARPSPGVPGDVSLASYAGDSAFPAPALGAIRSDPTAIRIWIAPWEDVDGDLNDESRVYLQIDSGRWLIEHNRERIRREFAPLAGGTSLPHMHSAPAAANAARPGGGAAAQRPSASLAASTGLVGQTTQSQGDAR